VQCKKSKKILSPLNLNQQIRFITFKETKKNLKLRVNTTFKNTQQSKEFFSKRNRICSPKIIKDFKKRVLSPTLTKSKNLSFKTYRNLRSVSPTERRRYKQRGLHTKMQIWDSSGNIRESQEYSAWLKQALRSRQIIEDHKLRVMSSHISEKVQNAKQSRFMGFNSPNMLSARIRLNSQNREKRSLNETMPLQSAESSRVMTNMNILANEKMVKSRIFFDRSGNGDLEQLNL